MNVTGIVVTRGDVDVSPVVASMACCDETIVYDNSQEQDYKVYGRFIAAKRARNPVVFVVDDDAVTDVDAICKQYRPGVVTANVPQDRRPFYADGITLIGWGAIFHRALTACFDIYLKRWPMDDLFLRECDRIFTGLSPTRLIDIPFTHLPHAYGDDRMGMEKTHLQDLAEIRKRLAMLR
jgi:hypothetical protein